MKRIYLAGGCFWGTEKYLSLIPGVASTEVGYANGRTRDPTYEQVSHADTGHAETVAVDYDPERLSLTSLLGLFYKVIDPTSLNKQGGDVGTQYRTGIYYTDETDLPEIEASVALLQQRVAATIVIEVALLENYASAEAYHQKYLDKNPRGYCHIGPDKFAMAEKLR